MNSKPVQFEYVLFVSLLILKKMGMKGNILILGLALLMMVGCKDDPPEVIIVPPAETPRDFIDSHYFVKFGWGKTAKKDTVTIEVPDDTLGSDSVPFTWDLERDFMLKAFDLKHEKIIDTTGWSSELEWESTDDYRDLFPDDYNDFRAERYSVGYHYAPSAYFYPRGLYDYFFAQDETFEEYYKKDNFKASGDPEDEFDQLYQGIFGITFARKNEADTGAFWDIQDYLAHPLIKVGNVPWGRVGSEWTYAPDTILMWNNNAFEGVVLSYIDETNVEWRTDNPPTFQDGSYFVIKNKKINQYDGLTYYIIEGEFQALLYNDNKEYKLAKGGTFRTRILADVELEGQPE
ncbi:MAG TPA: hypothetical protein DCX14_10900 [Flavobacteriales bacterium]|nr:hypothetical protein [Flavobacteriales bacterium]